MASELDYFGSLYTFHFCNTLCGSFMKQRRLLFVIDFPNRKPALVWYKEKKKRMIIFLLVVGETGLLKTIINFNLPSHKVLLKPETS